VTDREHWPAQTDDQTSYQLSLGRKAHADHMPQTHPPTFTDDSNQWHNSMTIRWNSFSNARYSHKIRRL